MPVYVDDMKAAFFIRGRKTFMSHMIADTEHELLEMVDLIGLSRRHIQPFHFDLTQMMVAAAIRAGAIAITQKQAASMVALVKLGEPAGAPETAIQRWLDVRAALRLRPDTGLSAARIDLVRRAWPLSCGTTKSNFGIAVALNNNQLNPQ